MTIFTISPVRGAVAVSLTLLLSGCGDGFNIPGFGGGDRPEASAAASTLPRPDPDSRGVITYNTFQVMVARDSDTLDSMAARVGIGASELANHNGLPVAYRPRPGEVLALPANVGGTPQDNNWSPQGVLDVIDATPLPDPTGGAPVNPDDPALATTGTANPFQNGQPSPVIDPVRHRVQPGETAFTISRLYGVSVTALASWNGLDSEFTLRENQELLIPLTDQRVPQPPLETASVAAPEAVTPLPPPPSASQPLPENEDAASVETPASPNLAEDRTPPGGRLSKPVAGSVLRPYNPASGAGKNDGIDFAAAAGTTVTAAGGGEVALVSESLGGLGTIVLIRHPDDLITVYGRITGVTLQKGSRVSAGQQIGVVADGATPNLHFEVRRGTQAVDPGPYLGL